MSALRLTAAIKLRMLNYLQRLILILPFDAPHADSFTSCMTPVETSTTPYWITATHSVITAGAPFRNPQNGYFYGIYCSTKKCVCQDADFKKCNSSDGASSCPRKASGTRSFGRPPDTKSCEKALMQTKASLQHTFSQDLLPV